VLKAKYTIFLNRLMISYARYFRS